MKLYKLPGSDEFVSWDVLHNEQGYSLDATNPVTWLSAGTVAHEWGETVAGGYMEPTEDDGWSTNGFCHGKNGWHNMDDMANIFYVWPNIATSTKAWNNSLGESNVAVWEYDGENSLYLVQKELQEGWMNEETFAERGWEIVPAVVLPTVTKLGTLYNTWGTVNAGGMQTLRTTSSSSGPTLDYDNSSTYAVWYYLPSGGGSHGDLSKVAIVSNSGYVAITATEYVQAYYVGVYTCNSLSVTITVVYDSSNVAYNAFKYTVDNTDYYYVLDGTQTDWTDDLGSIGYSLTPAVITAYFTIQGASATSDKKINPGSAASTFYALYDASGDNISRDASKTYTFYKAYRYDGTEEGFVSTPLIGTGGYWYLDFHVPGSGWSSYAYRVEYTVS